MFTLPRFGRFSMHGGLSPSLVTPELKCTLSPEMNCVWRGEWWSRKSQDNSCYFWQRILQEYSPTSSAKLARNVSKRRGKPVFIIINPLWKDEEMPSNFLELQNLRLPPVARADHSERERQRQTDRQRQSERRTRTESEQPACVRLLSKAEVIGMSSVSNFFFFLSIFLKIQIHMFTHCNKGSDGM